MGALTVVALYLAPLPQSAAPPLPAPVWPATPNVTAPMRPPTMETSIGLHHMARRHLGPIHTQGYSSMEQYPEVHGYVTVCLTRADTNVVDTFMFRQRIELDPNTGTIPMMAYHEARRVLPTFNEVEIQDLDIQFGDSGEMLLTWREIAAQ